MSAEVISQVVIDWSQILSIIIGSATLSAVISAIVNYYLTMRELSKKRDMGFVQDKLDLYSVLIYHLDEMRHKYNALSSQRGDTNEEERYAFNVEEIDLNVKAIDDRIRESYYLLNPEIHKKWVYVKTLLSEADAIKLMPEMRMMLVEEYNAIVSRHLKGLRDVVPIRRFDDKN